MKRILALLTLVLVLSTILNAQRISAEEIVQKHLDSIATKEIRAKNKNVSLVGSVQLTVGPSVHYSSTGRSVFASEGQKILFAMTFPLQSYPLEKIVWDGKNSTVGFPTQGQRSALGEFLATNDGLFREGLLGGVLGKDWALLDLDGRKGRLTSSGTKKIDGKEAYVCSYEAKKGLGLTIRLYFDKETFRHVRTEYFRTIAAPMGPTPEASSRQTESIENLTEDFFDFKAENGLVLPRGYRVTLLLQAAKTNEYRYDISFTDIYYNQDLDPSTFSKDEK